MSPPPDDSLSHRSGVDRGHGAPDDVALVEWPEHATVRRNLAERRVPRLLLIAADAPPPESIDELEDWMRRPANSTEVVARSNALLDRARRLGHLPVLDDDGLLWFAGRWVAVPDAQIPVVALLVGHLGRLVRTDAVRSAYTRAGGSGHAATLRTLIGRLASRVGEVGLELRTVRGRGLVLELPAVT